MKTEMLSQELSGVLDDDEDCSAETQNLSQLSRLDSSSNISSAIKELLDPRHSLPEIHEEPCEAMTKKRRDYEATDHLTTNDHAWNETLNKTKPDQKMKQRRTESTLKKKMSLNIEPALIKPIRNPRKPLSKAMSSSSLNQHSAGAADSLPDLETILLEKSRSALVPEVKRFKKLDGSDIKSSVDSGWLDRNISSQSIDKEEISHTLSNTHSFGLSNLNLKSFSSSSSLTMQSLNAEVTFHALDASDHEVVANSEDETEPIRPLLHIAKKRRLSSERVIPVEAPKEQPADKPEEPAGGAVALPKKAPEKPKRLSLRKPKIVAEIETIEEQMTFDGDDSDRDPTFAVEKLKEASPPIMKRKRSVIKRSKDGISKITKKATKLLSRGKKASLDINQEVEPSQEEEINFLIDSDLNAMTTVPRASQKELKTTEKLFDNYLKNNDKPSASAKPTRIIDAKTAEKKAALEKKVASGSLNENFVRVNLKKKVFVRGKKAFSFSKYKKTVWKSRKAAAALSGPDMDMRGCDGGVLRCHACGDVGHFAQQCKKKGDNLLPIDAEVKDESPFPTLEEAAEMANNQKLLVHSRKPEQLPAKSNDVWKNLNNSGDGSQENFADKENKDQNSESNDAPAVLPKVSLWFDSKMVITSKIISFRLSSVTRFPKTF